MPVLCGPADIDRLTLLPAPTGRRLGTLFLGYLAAVVAVITLAPFQFATPAHFSAAWMVTDGGWATDAILNVVLFLPLGFLWQRMTGRQPIAALLLGLAVGASIESAQLFLAPRYSTMSDLLANGSGAWLGAIASASLTRRVATGRFVTTLWLDQPLMGLVYLLIPLLWLDGLGAAGEASRLWLLVPLGSAGALAIAAVAVAVRGNASPPLSLWPITGAIAWFALGMVPALRVSPRHALMSLAATAMVAAIGGPLWRATLRGERRLEPQVVRGLLPLLLIVVGGTSASAGSLSLVGSAEIARVAILRVLEQAAAFTLLGYLVAEWRGRREEPLRRLVAMPLVVAVLVMAVVDLTVVPWQSLFRPAACLLATGYGALMYDAQRAHVVALRAGG